MRRNRPFAAGLWGLIPTLLLSSCGGGSGTDHGGSGTDRPPPAITVTVEPAAVTVQAGTPVVLTAALQNDTADTGVTWSISPTSGAGRLADQTPTSVTYVAPVDPPATELTATITATARGDASKSDAAVITVSPIFIAIDPPGMTVEAGRRLTLTAKVENDPSQAGVTWSMSPVTGAGELVEVTSTSATYEAPASPPPEDVHVTITANSVADPALAVPAIITVPSIVVQLAPSSILIPADTTQVFVATVSGDPESRGVRWALMQGVSACSPTCGYLKDVDPTSATFVAPATVPPDAHVTLTAISIADRAKHSRADIEISTGTVMLVPASLDFGFVKANNRRTKGIVLTNAGSAALAVSGMTIAGQSARSFSVEHHCGTSVAAGASCRVDVTFSPTAHGSYSAVLSIADSSPDSPQHVRLSGYSVTTAALTDSSMRVAPVPTGPHPVGTTTVELIDPAREDPYRPDGTKRELAVRFWYPATGGSRCSLAPYTDAAVWRHLSGLLQLPLPVVRTNSCRDARLPPGAYPVVVFTHGYTGTLTDYTYLYEDLASRGYIVASIGHTYESTAVSFRDGRLATSVLGSHLTTARMDLQTLAFVESVRLADLRFLVDELARLNSQPGSPLVGHLDLASIGIAGHSLGGLTALEAGTRDPRIRAVVAIDGVMPDRSYGLTDVPVLLLDAGRERWSADEEELWRKLRGPRWALNLEDAEHVAPSDLIWLARSAIKSGRMTPEQTVAATREAIAAFLDSSLRGLPVDPLLERRSAGLRETEATALVH